MNSVICNSYTLPLNFNNYPPLAAIVLSTYSLLNFDYFFLISYLVVQLLLTTWTGALQAFLSFTISWSLLRLVSFELMIPSNNLILCFPLLLKSFPASGSLPLSWLLHIRRPKYWTFSFSISPSNE